MALVMNLNALGQEALAALTPTAVEEGATALGLHACAESELAFAGTF